MPALPFLCTVAVSGFPSCRKIEVFLQKGESMQYPPQGSNEPGQYPYAPPPPPPRQRGFSAWYRRQALLVKILVWLVAAFLIIFVGSAAIAGIAESQSQSGDATPTAQAAPTQAPTRAPTATPKPRVIPTRVQIDDALINSGTEATVVSYDRASGVLVAQMGFGYKVAVTQSAVKGAIDDVQKTLWQKGWYFASVRV